MSYQFQGQRPHEDVILITHQHPFVLLHSVLLSVLIFLIPFLIYTVSPTGTVLSLAVVLALILGGYRLLSAWYGWNRTLFLVTTERILFLEQHGFFKRELIEAPLKNIDQVSHSVTGLLHTVFGYGTLNLTTASSMQPIAINHVPYPYDIQQEILQTQHGEGFITE
jgi:hypothetical protein